MRVRKDLVIEPAQSWARLQEVRNSEWFIHDLEGQMKENHRLFLEELMRYDRQQHLGVAPYERGQRRADQANGFYKRTLVTRLGPMELAVPRSRSGMFQPQILRRYQRREAAVDEALRKVFLLGVSTRQAGPALATLLNEAVSGASIKGAGEGRFPSGKSVLVHKATTPTERKPINEAESMCRKRDVLRTQTNEITGSNQIYL